MSGFDAVVFVSCNKNLLTNEDADPVVNNSEKSLF